MTMLKKEIWIVEGRVTCLEAHPTAQIGDPEWQFSDGPPGQRGYSKDYLSIEEGMREYPDALFHFDPEPKPDLKNYVELSPAAADHAGRVLRILLASSHTARQQAILNAYFGRGRTGRALLEDASNALLALGNDTDAIVSVGGSHDYSY